MVLVEYTYSSMSYHNCKDRRAFVEIFVWTVNRPNSSRYEELPVVIIMLLDRSFQLLNTTFILNCHQK